MHSIEKRVSALEAASFSVKGFRAVIQRMGETESEALKREGLTEDFRGLTVFILRFSWDYRPSPHRIGATS